MLELTTIQKIVLAVAVVALGSSGAYVFVTRSDTPPPASVYEPPSYQQQVTYVIVHVAGAVQHPGLYTLRSGARAYEAIQQAGGFTADADTESVNLAAIVKDGEKIEVTVKPTETAPPQQALPPPEEVSSRRAPPEPEAGLAPSQVQPVTPPAREPPSPLPAQRAPAREQPILVDLNTATQQQLERVPGIGPVLAERILRYRAQYGPFRRIEELMLIEGIGPRTFELLKPYVTLQNIAVQ